MALRDSVWVLDHDVFGDWVTHQPSLRAGVYDFRGITDTLEEDNHLLGLLRFKVGTGGQAVEYLGEWDFPLNKFLHKALDL